MCSKKLFIALFLFSFILIANSTRFGLFSTNDEPLELLDLQTHAIVEGPFAEVLYTQTYKNPYDKLLETEFYFPRTENSVFYKFEAIFKNQTIVGQILEKESAKELYELNVNRGHTVAYAEKNKETPDVMQVKVGNIPPNESVEIRFSVIQPLEVVINKYFGVVLPSVLTERYAPVTTNLDNIPQIQNVQLQNSRYQKWKITVEIKSQTPFSFISNPSHQFKPTLSDGSSKIYKANWDVTIIPNKNFVVYFRPESIEAPTSILAAHPNFKNDHVLLINFVPEFNKIESKKAEKFLGKEGGIEQLKQLILNEDIEKAKAEFIFVIDRSGSMMHLRIENLKKALSKFFETLPKNSFFNIVSFGSHSELYKPESVKYSPESLKEVINWIQTIDSDMGGTEILTALKRASDLPLIKGFPRTVIILTDGDVSNPSEIVRYVRDQSSKTRFCSVGIGDGTSEFLIKNIAKAGRCTSEFVLDKEDIGEKAIYMIKAAISQYLEDINFKIECFDKEKKSVFSEEQEVGVLLKDHPFKKWVTFPNSAGFDTCKVHIEFYSSFEDRKFVKEIDISGFDTAEITETWHKVAYDDKIKEMDLVIKSNVNKQELKDEIIELSLKYQVLSEYTSFLAVIQENDVDQETQKMKIKIPNLDSADYDGDKAVFSGQQQQESVKGSHHKFGGAPSGRMLSRGMQHATNFMTVSLDDGAVGDDVPDYDIDYYTGPSSSATAQPQIQATPPPTQATRTPGQMFTYEYEKTYLDLIRENQRQIIGGCGLVLVIVAAVLLNKGPKGKGRKGQNETENLKKE